MANEIRQDTDLYIKETRKSKRLFVTSSDAMVDDVQTTSTTISSSVFNEMSSSFANGDHLLDSAMLEANKPILYMLQQIEDDLTDVYNEVSASVFESSYLTAANIDTGSVGVISSSLIPNSDNVYDLGSSTKEWKDLYVDGTANIDTGNITAGHITRIDGPMGETLITFSASDTTPTVSKGNMFKTANTRTTNIKSFTGGVAGQEVTIILKDGYTDFTHGGARNTGDLTLQGGTNWTAGTTGDTITLVSDGTYWYEKCRSDNTR